MPTARMSRRSARSSASNFPHVFVSLSSVVLPEYREYERAMTTLVDVLVKPYCKTYLRKRRRQDPRELRRHSLPHHAVERRRGEALDGRRAAGHHAALGTRRGRPRLDPHGAARRLPGHPDDRRRRHLDRRGHHRELQADVHLDLAGRELPGEDADARHRHRRLRRRLDRLDRPLRPAQGRAAERRRRSRARSATARAAPSRP